jgi:hypothetical protein
MYETGRIQRFKLLLCLVLIVTYIPLSIRITKTSLMVAPKKQAVQIEYIL